MEMLRMCGNPSNLEVLDFLGTQTGVHKPTPEAESALYGSCEEAG